MEFIQPQYKLDVTCGMENTNTYKAILLGTTIVFGGCLIWLLILRNDLERADAAVDQSKLKYETLLSEKLLIEKSLNKKTKLLDTLKNENIVLSNGIDEREKMLLSTRAENSRMVKTLDAERAKFQEAEKKAQSLASEVKNSAGRLDQVDSQLTMKTDSILRLAHQVAVLQSRLDDAITRSIDQTLILAEKRNDKITSKARRTKELVAQVELPIELNKLTFTVERPDGSVLSTDATLSARQLASEGALTASLTDMMLPAFKTKKMEIVYKPKEKLNKGVYVFKIFNGSDYVGSMNIQLQ
jgi:hypothetical protein